MKLHDIIEFKQGTDTRTNTPINTYKIKESLSKDDYIKLNNLLKADKCYYSKFVKGFICPALLNLEEDFELDDNADSSKKPTTPKNKSVDYSSFGKDFKYIRHAIIHKSLGLDRLSFECNGDKNKYLKIWDELPVVEGLQVTDEAYSAIWGYDQTNVDIAYRLNKKVWGLDVFTELGHNGKPSNFMFVREKDKHFNDGIRYFSYDKTPDETFKHDASQTGFYR